MTISLSSLEISPLSSIFPPESQKAGDRPISFFLVDGTAPNNSSSTLTGGFLSNLSSLANAVAGGSTPVNSNTTSVSLNIRPEELTRTDPSRAIVQQTLGGAWVDDFGPGMAVINISGTTGWRGTATADGITLFKNLRKLVYSDFHTKRENARKAGNDPSKVQLIFSDALDSMVENVIPLNFTLRRSRSRPLLMMYQIQMVSLGAPAKAPATQSALGAVLGALGLTSLQNSVNSITNAISTAQQFVQTTILGPVKAFMGIAVQCFNSVIGMVNSATGIISSVLSTAQSVARAGASIFQTIASAASLPAAIKAQAMATAAAFTNVLCLVKNAFSSSTYPDYSPILGASNCSSTSGGSPPSQYTLNGTNPFDDVVGTAAQSPITLSVPAATALSAIANSDPALSPMSTTAIGTNLLVVNSGLKVNA